MFASDLIQLSNATRDAANLLGRWLAQQETALPPVPADDEVIVLAGNAALRPSTQPAGWQPAAKRCW